MKNVKETVLSVYRKVLDEMQLNTIHTDESNKIGRESGLDSLGFVNLIVGIEEELDISLDSVLIQLRQTKRLSEVINIVLEYMDNPQ